MRATSSIRDAILFISVFVEQFSYFFQSPSDLSSLFHAAFAHPAVSTKNLGSKSLHCKLCNPQVFPYKQNTTKSTNFSSFFFSFSYIFCCLICGGNLFFCVICDCVSASTFCAIFSPMICCVSFAGNVAILLWENPMDASRELFYLNKTM